ncbi:Developmental regulator flbA [Venturia nashicola]|uniref:Developmental regulator flbA n=1 Tax=Venturia nashicola TaxID=86259 RepID=A0A4Z1NLY4_9PEZI|nr:Developmental regulator flbA [Venturia nashicola]
MPQRHSALTTSSSPSTTRSSMSTASNLSKLTNASSIPPTQRSTDKNIIRSACTYEKFYLTLKSKQDFKDLFSTLMVSLPLTPHRVRFQKIDHTFTSEEAITNLGSLKFSQSNRMPDPKDPSRIVTTTTTTTFSMAKEMARSVCTKFLEARFIETADGKSDFSSKSAVWQLTPKGMHILQRFCQRNGINQRHVFELLASPRNTMNLVLLERQAETDKIHRDLATLEVVFRRFVGPEPNVKYSTSNSDSDSLSEYQTGLVGVKLAKERKIGDKAYHNTFTGKACADWLMDCCTMVDKRETNEVAQLFCDFGLMRSLEVNPSSPNPRFNPSKSAIYVLTERGQRVAGWIPSAKTSNGDVSVNGRIREPGTARDSNTNRMTIVIGDPALRLLFREFLRDTHCEENLAFYLDVRDFLANYHAAKRHHNSPNLEVIRETLAAAYSLYNAFLAPGSPCELNIDHSLRTSLAARMTRAVGDDEAMIKSLDEVATLFDQAQNSVFKLMASDSVPKFMRESKYAGIIRERNLDAHLGGSFHASTPSRSTGSG